MEREMGRRVRRRRFGLGLLGENEVDGEEDRDGQQWQGQVAAEGAAWTALPALGTRNQPLSSAATSVLPLLDGHADRRATDEQRRRILQQEQQRAPEAVVARIDPARLGPRVRARQLDLMEQARLYELQIWSQRAEGGGLTDRQRELLVSGPMLVPIPEDRMLEAQTVLGEIMGGDGAEVWEARQTLRRYRGYLRPQGGRQSTAPTVRQIGGVDDRDSPRVRFAGNETNAGARTPGNARRDSGDALMQDVEMLSALSEASGADERRSVRETGFHDDGSVRSSPQHAHCLQQPQRGSNEPEEILRDMPTIAVKREPGQQREGWELVERPPADTKDDGLDMSIATCPCHQPHDWKIITNLPTHCPLSTKSCKDSLADLRDCPWHSTTPVFDGGGELLSENTWEILVSFEACGHRVAVFVERLNYEDASHIRAGCECYGFDRCLVASRRARSLEKCLICRLRVERETWRWETGRDGEERWACFEAYVRPVEGRREVALWPFGARDSRAGLQFDRGR